MPEETPKVILWPHTLVHAYIQTYKKKPLKFLYGKTNKENLGGIYLTPFRD